VGDNWTEAYRKLGWGGGKKPREKEEKKRGVDEKKKEDKHVAQDRSPILGWGTKGQNR